jgi:hypothetical protein
MKEDDFGGTPPPPIDWWAGLAALTVWVLYIVLVAWSWVMCP